MELHILGSGSAEGWPAIWCRCDLCQEARRRGGKDIRTRSGALVDGTLKIDLGPDTYHQVVRDNIDLAAVEHLIVTHSHDDHFAPWDLWKRKTPFAHGIEHPLTLWAGDLPLEMARHVLKAWGTENIALRTIRPFQPFQAGDFRVTPLLADHSTVETCYIYRIERDGKRLLWGHDTGFLPADTWEYLTGREPFDAVVLDCTSGPNPRRNNHMGLDGVLAVRAEMLQRGIARQDTTFVATHFSHNGGLLHAELTERFAPHGVLVAYDGMRLMI